MTDPIYSEYLRKRAITQKAHKLYLKKKTKLKNGNKRLRYYLEENKINNE